MDTGPSQPSIRKTVEADEETLWLMLYYASHSDDEPGVEPDDVRSNPDLVGYVEGWRDNGKVGVIAEMSGVPVGAAWLRWLGDEDRANPVFISEDFPELAIAVLPGHQGRGIGTSMLAGLLEQCAGVAAIVLSARRDNPAVRLYERFGFETIDEITNRVGTVSVRMLRRLTGE